MPDKRQEEIYRLRESNVDLNVALEKKKADTYSLKAELAAAEERAECNTCCGQPHVSGLTCVCGGANTARAEADGLREEWAREVVARKSAEERAEKLSAHNKTLAQQFALMGEVRAERTALRAENEALRRERDDMRASLPCVTDATRAKARTALGDVYRHETDPSAHASIGVVDVNRARDALTVEYGHVNNLIEERDALRAENEALRRELTQTYEENGRLRGLVDSPVVDLAQEHLRVVALRECDAAIKAKEEAEARICRDPCCPTLHKEYERGYNDANALVNTQAKMLGKERDARDAALANTPEPEACECAVLRMVLGVLALWSGDNVPQCDDVVAMQDYAAAALEQQPAEEKGDE